MKIKIITDSTADLAPEIVSSLDITVIPIYIHFGLETYRDGIDLTADEFYKKLTESGIYPKTAQPSPDDFFQEYSDAIDKYDGIVSIHISSKISGTLDSARIAAARITNQIPLQLIDSKLNSAGLALVTTAAAQIAKTGADFDTVISETLRAIDETRMFGMFETTKYLIHGGRANQAIVSAAKMLRIMPMLTFHDGHIMPTGFVRTINSGVNKIYNYVRSKKPIRELSIVHSLREERALQLKRRLAEFLPEKQIGISQLGAALGSHGGPGVLLVALRQKKTN